MSVTNEELEARIKYLEQELQRVATIVEHNHGRQYIVERGVAGQTCKKEADQTARILKCIVPQGSDDLALVIYGSAITIIIDAWKYRGQDPTDDDVILELRRVFSAALL